MRKLWGTCVWLCCFLSVFLGGCSKSEEGVVSKGVNLILNTIDDNTNNLIYVIEEIDKKTKQVVYRSESESNKLYLEPKSSDNTYLFFATQKNNLSYFNFEGGLSGLKVKEQIPTDNSGIPMAYSGYVSVSDCKGEEQITLGYSIGVIVIQPSTLNYLQDRGITHIGIEKDAEKSFDVLGNRLVNPQGEPCKLHFKEINYQEQNVFICPIFLSPIGDNYKYIHINFYSGGNVEKAEYNLSGQELLLSQGEVLYVVGNFSHANDFSVTKSAYGSTLNNVVKWNKCYKDKVSGQNQRASETSEDKDISHIEEKYLLCTVNYLKSDGSVGDVANNVCFDLYENVHMGADKLHYSNLGNGSLVSNKRAKGAIYVANPKGCSSNFVVTLTGVSSINSVEVEASAATNSDMSRVSQANFDLSLLSSKYLKCEIIEGGDPTSIFEIYQDKSAMVDDAVSVGLFDGAIVENSKKSDLYLCNAKNLLGAFKVQFTNYYPSTDILSMVTSAPKPLEGQSHRSSMNFMLSVVKHTSVRVECPEGVTFDVMSDVVLSGDLERFKGLKNGSQIAFDAADDNVIEHLYIANPAGSTTAFNVTFKRSESYYAGITSSSVAPLPNQSHRSGYDFDLFADAKGLYTSVIVSCPSNVTFDIYETVENGTDHVVYRNLGNGSIVPLSKNVCNAYVANPKFSSSYEESDFVVKFSYSLLPQMWMSYLPESVNLNELSLLGTHDAGSFYYPDVIKGTGRTQNGTIETQLYDGVRVFDLRLCNLMGRLIIAHGPISCFITFSEVMEMFQTFLQRNKQEAIVILVNTATSSVDGITELFMEHQDQLYFSDKMPKLEAVRGKIVVVSRFSGISEASDCIDLSGDTTGYAWLDNKTFTMKSRQGGLFAVEDEYKEFNTQLKQKAITKHLDKAATNKADSTCYMTFTSVQVEVMAMNSPYKFAWENISDNESNNRAVISYLNQNQSKFPLRYGILFTDFYNDGGDGVDNRIPNLCLRSNFTEATWQKMVEETTIVK